MPTRRPALLLDSAGRLFDFCAVRADSRNDRLELVRTDAELFGLVVEFIALATGDRAPVLRPAFAPIVRHDSPPPVVHHRAVGRRLNHRPAKAGTESDEN